ncbi:MAG TPA: histidine kinase [Steroidobacteraceae bacterium]
MNDSARSLLGNAHGSRADKPPAPDTPPAARHRSRIRQDLGLLAAFWAYVALSNVLWGLGMQASLASLRVDVFSPWDARLVQHLLLFPALIGCLWLSRRIGWQPLWRAAPLQLLCGLFFAALASPAMDVAERVTGDVPWATLAFPSLFQATDGYAGQQGFEWAASATTFLLAYCFGLALLTGFNFYRSYRDAQLRSASLERSLSAAHLSALRMQLSPHTLFNLLHTIKGHVAWDPPLAQSMIVQLSDLLRRALRNGERELCPLEEELEFVRLYLQLQQRRFADRLIVAVPERGSSPAIWVPSLILQPLVENAVIHGLAHNYAPVSVRVDAQTVGETLVLRVVNSLVPGYVGAASESVGIGLKNVRERLSIQFGEHATFNAGRSPSENWEAEIRLPVLHALPSEHDA